MPKLLIVVLAGVAVLAFVLIGLGVTREPGSADPDEHGWVDRFEFGGAPPVEVDHIVSSGCFEAARRLLVVPGTTSCTTRIGAADGPMRLLRLEAPAGERPALRIDLAPADEDGVEIDGWDPDDDDFPLRVPVGPGGGTLTIRCLAALGSCGLRLVGDEEAGAPAVAGNPAAAPRP